MRKSSLLFVLFVLMVGSVQAAPTADQLISEYIILIHRRNMVSALIVEAKEAIIDMQARRLIIGKISTLLIARMIATDDLELLNILSEFLRELQKESIDLTVQIAAKITQINDLMADLDQLHIDIVRIENILADWP